MTRPNSIYSGASIDDADDDERCRMERRNFEAKVGACIILDFCDAILSSEENWNSMTSYTEGLLKSKKFNLDERSRVDV